MLKVGLTGGIGCGKSTAVDVFRVLCVPIVDADKISKKMVEKGSEALKEIATVFGEDLLLESGELNRSLLKQKIFSDSNILKKIEAILHPRIKAEIQNQILAIKGHAYVVVDIPLLVEKNYQAMFDQIIVIDCLPEQQISRVGLRDDLSESDITKIMQNQTTQEQRNNSATIIIDNTQSKEFLISQIKRLHTELVALS
jgi:dephospho-CoA kinase